MLSFFGQYDTFFDTNTGKKAQKKLCLCSTTVYPKVLPYIYIYILIFNINVSETVQIMSLAMAHRYVLR